MVQNDKKILSIALHIWGIIDHMTVIYVCKLIISSSVFSIFLKTLIFWVHRGVKGQKMVQNDKKLCLSHTMSQEPYIIWLSFMVQMCKMIMSPGGEGAKNGPKCQKFLSVAPYVSGTIYHIIFIYGTHVYIKG